MPDDLRELENLVVKEATLHRLTSFLFAMAGHVNPICVPHCLKDAFHCRLLVLQAVYGDATGQVLHQVDFILRVGYRRRIRCRWLSDSKNREVMSYIRRR